MRLIYLIVINVRFLSAIIEEQMLTWMYKSRNFGVKKTNVSVFFTQSFIKKIHYPIDDFLIIDQMQYHKIIPSLPITIKLPYQKDYPFHLFIS